MTKKSVIKPDYDCYPEEFREDILRIIQKYIDHNEMNEDEIYYFISDFYGELNEKLVELLGV